jgi:hypothetical protein
MWSNISHAHVFLVSILGATPNDIPLKYNRCPIELGMSTLQQTLGALEALNVLEDTHTSKK